MKKNYKWFIVIAIVGFTAIAAWRIITFAQARAEYIKDNKWKQDFEVTYEWIEGSDVSQYSSAYEVLMAYANNEFVLPYRKYTIKNLTNNSLKNVVAIFEFKLYLEEPFEYREKLGLGGYMQQGETVICEISDSLVAVAAEFNGIDDETDTVESVKLLRIEYEVDQ